MQKKTKRVWTHQEIVADIKGFREAEGRLSKRKKCTVEKPCKCGCHDYGHGYTLHELNPCCNLDNCQFRNKDGSVSARKMKICHMFHCRMTKPSSTPDFVLSRPYTRSFVEEGLKITNSVSFGAHRSKKEMRSQIAILRKHGYLEYEKGKIRLRLKRLPNA